MFKVTKTPTWRELKEKINSIDEKHLDQPVRWWGDERGGLVYSLQELDEEYLKSDEGWEPVSAYEDDNPEDYPDRMQAGSPVLFVD